jgi:hypothetical protein
MRQIAGSFSTALAAITLQDRQFANATQVAGVAGTTVAANWVDDLQSALAARGMAPGQAHAAALAALSGAVDQQANLLACEDLYRLLAVLACITALIVLVQRQLK